MSDQELINTSICIYLALFLLAYLLFNEKKLRTKISAKIDKLKDPRHQKIRSEVQLVIDLILAGRDWTVGNASMFHPSGTTVWTANSNSTIRWGAINVYDFVDPSAVGHEYYLKGKENKQIRKAIEQFKLTQKDPFLDAAVRKAAISIKDMYSDAQNNPFPNPLEAMMEKEIPKVTYTPCPEMLIVESVRNTMFEDNRITLLKDVSRGYLIHRDESFLADKSDYSR